MQTGTACGLDSHSMYEPAEGRRHRLVFPCVSVSPFLCVNPCSPSPPDCFALTERFQEVEMNSPRMRRLARYLSIGLLLVACGSSAHAEVKRIVIDRKVSPAFDGKSFGAAGQYETLAGRAFGELDPNDPHNRVITDIRLARKNANGKVEYVASFFLVKPIDMSKASHLMWHDVPNRGG